MNCIKIRRNRKIAKIVVIFKGFQFFDRQVHIFTISLAPTKKYFSFLGFIGDSQSQSVCGDGRFVCNFGFVFLLIIS